MGGDVTETPEEKAHLLARQAFERSDWGSQTTISYTQFVLSRWQNKHFGAVPHTQLALGVAEEAGELCHAVLKHVQKIRGLTDEKAYRLAAADALADVVIYAMQFATALRLDLATLVIATAEHVMSRKDAIP